jgi:hypothetical protein
MLPPLLPLLLVLDKDNEGLDLAHDHQSLTFNLEHKDHSLDLQQKHQDLGHKHHNLAYEHQTRKHQALRLKQASDYFFRSLNLGSSFRSGTDSYGSST